MSEINGVVGSGSISNVIYIDERHPSLKRMRGFKADNGVIAKRTIVALDTNNEVVAYDDAAAAPVNIPIGIADQDIDTAVEQAGAVLEHGCAIGEHLLVADVAAVAAALTALEQNTAIFAV